jgi:hypothetical protein
LLQQPVKPGQSQREDKEAAEDQAPFPLKVTGPRAGRRMQKHPVRVHQDADQHQRGGRQ